MIGVYAHGRGHLHRVLPVVAALRDHGDEVTLLVAGMLGATLRPHGVRVEHLPVLEATSPGPDGEGLEVDVRRAALSWIDRARPRVFWVDGSPAMSLAAHLTGTPVVSSLPPGIRYDEPHLLRCRSARSLIGAWPPGSFPDTVRSVRGQVREVGGISRFERRDRVPGPPGRRRPLVVHLNSAGPRGDHRFWRAVRASAQRTGPVEWLEIGGPDAPWREDPWPELSTADVVVTCAGQSSVADAACCDVPMVVVPRRHEHGEHDATARALAVLPGVTVRYYGDGPTAVARSVCEQIDAALRPDSTGIRARWRVDGAAARAADAIRHVADTDPGPLPPG